jgi:hypothetical protein
MEWTLRQHSLLNWVHFTSTLRPSEVHVSYDYHQSAHSSHWGNHSRMEARILSVKHAHAHFIFSCTLGKIKLPLCILSIYTVFIKAPNIYCSTECSKIFFIHTAAQVTWMEDMTTLQWLHIRGTQWRWLNSGIENCHKSRQSTIYYRSFYIIRHKIQCLLRLIFNCHV